MTLTPRPVHAATRRATRTLGMLLLIPLMASACPEDGLAPTTDVPIATIEPASRSVVTYVGSFVLMGAMDEVRIKDAAGNPLQGFKVQFVTNNTNVVRMPKQTSPDYPASQISVDIVGAGEAQVTMTPINTLFLNGQTKRYTTNIIAYSTKPAIIDLPSNITMKVGEKRTLVPRVLDEANHAFTVGYLNFLGTNNGFIEMYQPDGKSVSVQVPVAPGDVLELRGVGVGTKEFSVEYSGTGGNVSIKKTITVTVVAAPKPVYMIAAAPIGPTDDPSSSRTKVSVGQGREYKIFEQISGSISNDGLGWASSNTAIADFTSATPGSGKGPVANCRAAGAVTINSEVFTDGSLFKLSTTLTCEAVVPKPTITTSVSSQRLEVGQPATVFASVLNAAGTSPVQWLSKDPSVVTVSPANTAALATGAPTTFTGVKVGGPVDVVATYTASGTTVSATVAVTVVAASSSSVAAMYVDALSAEFTPTAGNFYRARLFDAAGNEVSATTDGGTIQYGSNNPAVITIDAASGFSTAKTAGSTQITAKYVRNGVTVATAVPSPVTVYVPNTPGHYGALQISLQGDVRRITVGATLQFQVIVRNTSGIQLLPESPAIPNGVRSQLEVTSSNPSALVIADVAATTGFFYTMRAAALPTSSAVPGIPNVVTVKADIMGAMVTIPMMIVP